MNDAEYKKGVADGRLSVNEETIREAVTEAVREVHDMVKDRWSFTESQQHTHSWHDKQDCLEAIRDRWLTCFPNPRTGKNT